MTVGLVTTGAADDIISLLLDGAQVDEVPALFAKLRSAPLKLRPA
jgi:hypothetical protein